MSDAVQVEQTEANSSLCFLVFVLLLIALLCISLSDSSRLGLGPHDVSALCILLCFCIIFVSPVSNSWGTRTKIERNKKGLMDSRIGTSAIPVDETSGRKTKLNQATRYFQQSRQPFNSVSTSGVWNSIWCTDIGRMSCPAVVVFRSFSNGRSKQGRIVLFEWWHRHPIMAESRPWNGFHCGCSDSMFSLRYLPVPVGRKLHVHLTLKLQKRPGGLGFIFVSLFWLGLVFLRICYCQFDGRPLTYMVTLCAFFWVWSENHELSASFRRSSR